jgi:hypothetical protein
MTADYTPLWQWVREREAIRLRKESGTPPPWTDDEILRTYRFCNVRREDDRVTVWIRDNIRKPFAGCAYSWLMCCIARIINWPDTLQELIAQDAWPRNQDFHPRFITDVLQTRQARGDKLYTGAYMIPAPATKGEDKQEFIGEGMIGQLWRRREQFHRAFQRRKEPFATLQEIHELITRSRGWGPFLAYQAVVDMRFTPNLLTMAEDKGRWAAAGPGTISGLNRVHGRPLNYSLSQERALGEMRAIYKIAADETDVEMDFSDVPNILCETDKYLRVKLGEGKPRALYVPGRGA